MEKTAEPQTPEGNVDTTKITDTAELQSKVAELLNENASRRIANKDLNEELKALRQFKEEQEKIQNEQLAEQGKFKELFEEQQKQLEELKKLPETLSQYEGVFKTQLDEEIKTLPETAKNMILQSGMNVGKQLEMARSLKAELGTSTSSPGMDRPGGNVPTQDVSQIVAKYNAEKDIAKRLEMFTEIKQHYPDAISKLK